MKKISIIIVTYNSRDLILDCINSIYQFTDIPVEELEIIVVDNSSEDEGRKLQILLEEHFKEKIIFIKSENLGYGYGNNIGVKKSTAPIIAIMNPDVRLSEMLFEKALSHFENNEIASVGFQQIGGYNFSYFLKPEFFIPIFSSLYNRILNNWKIFIEKQFYLSGAFVFFRKSDFLEIGLYDENIFMYFEEPDVAMRLNKIGKHSIFDKTRSYIHLFNHKEDFNVKLLDIGTASIKTYFDKFSFNLQRYLTLRTLEHSFYILIFKMLGNKERVEKNEAFVKTLTQLKN
jgi:GT2 family glycosyltransferase